MNVAKCIVCVQCVCGCLDGYYICLFKSMATLFLCVPPVCVFVCVCVCVCAYGAHFAQCMSGSALKGGGLEGRRGG